MTSLITYQRPRFRKIKWGISPSGTVDPRARLRTIGGQMRNSPSDYLPLFADHSRLCSPLPTEALFTVLGPDCETITRIHAEDTDVIAATWTGGRTGVGYGLRGVKRAYGLTAFGTEAVVEDRSRIDFLALARTVMAFLQTGEPPLSVSTTLEILAFMEAADESERRGGAPVHISEILA